MNAAALYPWLKAMHVAAAITFVGGVLAAAVVLQAVVPQNWRSNDTCSLWGTVKSLRAWHRAVTTPAMLMVWAFGIILALQAGWFASVWLQAKFVLVVVLSAVHGVQSGALRRLEDGSTVHLPALRFSGALTITLVAGIAVLAIVKPL